jgi:uncharacterized protein with HEPN domain
MAERSYLPRLDDIVIAIEHVKTELMDVPLPGFEADWRKRYVVERGVEIISEASRYLPDDLKARHPEIPWPKVAGIGNVLRHDYEGISPSIMWTVARDDLPPLERVCRAELAAGLAREQDSEDSGSS